MNRVIRYLKPYRSKIALIILIALFFSVLNLANAWLMGRLTEAIFNRTKGLPVSLNLKSTNQKSSLSINLTRKTPWDARDLPEVRKKFKQTGVVILATRREQNSLFLKITAPKDLADKPYTLISTLQNNLAPKFKGVEAYFSAAQTKAKPQLVLFSNYYTIYLIPLILIIVYLLIGVCRFTQNFMIGAIGQKIVMQLRNQIYGNIQNLSLSYFERNKAGQTGQLIARILSDIDAIQFLFTSGFFEMILEPMVVVIGLIWSFILNWQLTLVFFLAFPLLAWPIDRLSKKLRKVNLEMMNKVADITGVLEETLGAIKVIKAFGMENFEVERFRRETRYSYQVALRNLRISQIFLPIIELMVAIGLAVFLTFGGSLVINNKLTPSEFFTFVFLMSYMANPIRKLSGVFGHIPRAVAAAERVFELIDARSEVAEAEHPVKIGGIIGEVAFDRVTFGYEPENIVLKDISFVVKPGEVIALVGPSGAGKTTVVNLISRFYDPCEGSVKIDGYNLRELKLASFRKQMGIVPQETILFRGTIAENIAYGKLGATMEEIVAAAKAANADEFISGMADGYQTKVGSRGFTLSGGQRQRIAIARALLRDPRILILDEATSALDTQSEVLVQEALQRLMRGRTCFVIAHRLSTIRSANRIVVLKQGKIEEIGTHLELLAKNGLYAVLYQTQFRRQAEADQ